MNDEANLRRALQTVDEWGDAGVFRGPNEGKAMLDVKRAISENFGKLLVIRRHSQSNALMAEFGMGREADESITRSSISGRVEHNLTPGYCDFFIEEQMMKAHCAAHSFGYAAFCKKLAETNNIMVEFLKKDMTAKTKAPPMRVQAIKVRRRLEDVGEILQNPPALEAA